VRLHKLGFAGAVVLGALFAFGAPSPAHAAIPVTRTGWWTRSPAPPAVEKGGLSVGDAPDGDLSVAAFEVDTAGGASGPKLTLTETGGQGQQTGALQACTTTDGWAAVDGGDLNLAPRATCPDKPLLLTRDNAGAWTVDLTQLLNGKTGTVSVMVLPAPPAADLPANTRPKAFQVAFSAPKLAGSTLPAPVEEDTTAAATSDSFAVPSYDAFPTPDLTTAITEPSAPLPELAASPATPAAVDAPNQIGGASPNFAVANHPTKGRSRLVIIGWFVLACVVGAAAAGWHWARDNGAFENLLPFKTRGLLPPA
jgi:hypothetical protein